MAEREARAEGVAILWALALIVAAAAGFGPEVGSEKATASCSAGWVEVASRAGLTSRVGCGAGAEQAPVRGPARLLVGLPISLHRAAPETLEVLPQIGAARAAAIVEARCRAPFRSLDDLQRIHGIGPRTVEGLRGQAIPGDAAPSCPRASTLPP
jgi:hypothetical protein